jgi:CheY-like chemotaxis protein
VGYDLSIQLFAKVELARLQAVGRALAKMPEVVSVHLITGEYDLMAEVALRSNEELITFLTERVASLPGVLSTTTAHVPMTLKQRHEWALPEPAPPSVLIADDDPDFVEVTRLLLESHGYDVRSAPSGQDALDALLRRPADLLILDIMMDGVLDGWDAGRRVRNVSTLRRLPILVVSSITSSDYLHMVPTDDDNLISNFLSKPVDPDALLREVERLSRRT